MAAVVVYILVVGCTEVEHFHIEKVVGFAGKEVHVAAVVACKKLQLAYF
jgi:hypothetical protein